ncbi:BTAD domain-containing putative transcriptional regulator [Spongiactinospora sp. TRM90649]|uniref:AfsR/SARP family transcriptional regulator n=1 Tax=Spongiactinospora sp. TRM90649 TaxID=3031114 RepID=UPI0023F94EDD|nr:BTAD domain-containing putative transcriptional regulator [Spongiactinospora sp. TRM90649]MDF5758952.1 BTAD domain-containing putative transcriptional regulator [Spongiactinospora sp. TRM90649]
MASGVEFHILGTLRACVEGQPVDLGGRRARAVLTALLLDAGHTVTTDRLVGELWHGADPPPSARGQVHILVSRLRTAIGGVIATAPSGYRIDPRDVRLDAHTAQRLIAEGRENGDPAPYLAALALWRGPVLDGFDNPEVRRLEELRWTATEEWAELALAAGDPAPVVATLEPLVSGNPYHERLRAQLVMALDRLGRRAEALAVLDEGRRLLDDELGLAPGVELLRAERMIEQSAAEPPAPSQLPRPVATFTGREQEVRRLCALLAGGPERAVAISGPAGVGKSALAIRVAHEVADRFPDGHLYINLQGSTPDAEPVPPVEALGRFLRALGAAEVPRRADVEEVAATFRSLTHGRRLLIVLDNAANAAQVRYLLPGSASCGVLITSRRMLDAVDTASHHRLGVLAEAEAAALLSRYAGAERMAHDPEATGEVVRLCGGLPLALAIVGARLVSRPGLPVRELADRLAVEQRRLAELSAEDQAVRAGFMVSYRDLGDGDAARMFRLLGLLDGGDIGVPVAAALAGLPERRTAVLLDQLVESQLAESDVPGRFRMHDLLRLFARERAMEEIGREERRLALRRATHCYLATARRAALMIEPLIAWRIDIVPSELDHPGIPLNALEEVYAWIDLEIDNLLTAARQAVAEGDPAFAVQLAACLSSPLEQRARRREQLAFARTTLAAADRTGDPRHTGLGNNDVGWAMHALARPAEALECFDRALAAWTPIGYQTGMALALNGRGAALRTLGRHEESLTALERGAAIWRRLGHGRHEASCLTGLGLTYQRMTRYDEAVTTHERAVALARRAGAKVTEVMALGNLGEALRLAGEPGLAAGRFHEALELDRLRGLSGTYWEAEHLWGLGLATGDRSCLARSAAILFELGLITYEQARAIETDPAPATPEPIAHQL